jgi:predicted nucleotidyltransferase
MTQAPVQSKSEVKERLMQQAEQPWAFGVERIGLFGSFARDEAGLQSDVDLFVDDRHMLAPRAKWQVKEHLHSSSQ